MRARYDEKELKDALMNNIQSFFVGIRERFCICWKRISFDCRTDGTVYRYAILQYTEALLCCNRN